MKSNLLKKHAKSFYWASFFLSSNTLDKCSSLYNFCRTLDDIVDSDNSLEVKKEIFSKFKRDFENKNLKNQIIKDIWSVIDNENIVINKNAFDQCNKLNIVEFKENEFLLLFNNPSEEIPNIISLINSIIPIGKSYVTNNPSLYNLYKLSEISDLRPSSTMISASNNASELSFALEESINLINWHTNQLIEVNLPATNNIKFFRFRSF